MKKVQETLKLGAQVYRISDQVAFSCSILRQAQMKPQDREKWDLACSILWGKVENEARNPGQGEEMREVSNLLTLVLPIDWRILGLDRLLLLSQIVISNILFFLRHDCSIGYSSSALHQLDFSMFYNFRSRPRPLARIFKGLGLCSRERTLSLKISIVSHAAWSTSLKNQGPIFLGLLHQ